MSTAFSFSAVLPSKSDKAAWKKLATEFSERAGFPNCVGAGDGVLLPIYYQTGTDGTTYFSRKGFYALNFQVVVDANLRFMYIGGGLPGTVYDGHCWDRTSFGSRLASGSILPDDEQYYFIVDGGYVVCCALNYRVLCRCIYFPLSLLCRETSKC